MNRFKTAVLMVIGLCALFAGCADGSKDKPFWELGDYYTEQTAMDSPNLVRHIYPAHQATGVHPESSVHVMFDHIMDRFSVEEAFHLSPEVTGTISWETRSFTFTPALPLQENSKYEAILDASARDVYDMPLEGPVKWWFATGTAVPDLHSSKPANLATGVPVDSTITLVFNQPMQTYSVQKHLTIFPRIAGSLEWASPDTLTIRPSSPLKYYTEYEIRITQGALAMNGKPLVKDAAVTFWTRRVAFSPLPRISSTTPEPEELYVPIDTIPTVVMETKIDPTTVSDETVKLLKGSEPVAVTPYLQPDGVTLTITPRSYLAYDTDYSLFLSGAISDRDGRGFDGDRDGTAEGSPADDYSMTFTTVADHDPPLLIKAEALNSRWIKLVFNEGLGSGAGDLDHVAYGFTNEYNRIIDCFSAAGIPLVIVVTKIPLIHNLPYGITVSGRIEDSAGNVIEPGQVETLTGIGVGHDIEYEATDFTLSKILLPSETVKLSSIRDKPVVLHFFSVFSSVSREALATVDGIYPEYQDDFHFLCISLEGISQDQLPSGLTGGTTLLNSGRSAADTLHMTPVPGTMLLSRYGIIRWRQVTDFDENELRQQLEELKP